MSYLHYDSKNCILKYKCCTEKQHYLSKLKIRYFHSNLSTRVFFFLVPHSVGYLYYQGMEKLERHSSRCTLQQQAQKSLTSHPQTNSRNFTFTLYHLFPASLFLLHSLGSYRNSLLHYPLFFPFLPQTEVMQDYVSGLRHSRWI